MVIHFALLVFITSCVKVITFRVVITSCVNGITSRGDYYILRQYYILRRNTRIYQILVNMSWYINPKINESIILHYIIIYNNFTMLAYFALFT